MYRTTQFTNQEQCGPCPVFASFTPAFAVQLRKKHGKTSVRVRKTSVRVAKPQSGDEWSLSHSALLDLGASVAIVHRRHLMGPTPRLEILTLSDSTSDLVRQYDLPVPL
jgi:hypothetical protein